MRLSVSSTGQIGDRHLNQGPELQGCPWSVGFAANTPHHGKGMTPKEQYVIGADDPEEQGCLEFPQEPGPCWGTGLRLQNCHSLGLRDSCPQPIRAAEKGGVSWREGNALQNPLESWRKMSTEITVGSRSVFNRLVHPVQEKVCY